MSPEDASAGERRPPEGWREVARQLGPGLIITASIVGSGELIVTTKLGADVGFTLLWFIVLGCIVKVFVQVELGRYAISEGVGTLETLNRMPGPRLLVSWAVWLWLMMFLAVFFQMSGIVGSIADVFVSQGAEHQQTYWVIAVAASCALLLLAGSYGVVQRVSTIMVFLFTLFTILAVVALYWTDYALTSSQLMAGWQFRLPDDVTTAIAAFGIIGVGATELIYYPYWCIEKGYARFVGPREERPEWYARANGWIRIMRIDSWLSCIVYTLATIAFYLLGAAVLHARRLEVGDQQLIDTLSHMYRESFGVAGYWIFLCGAFMVLYSTFFVSTASNGRLIADALSIFGVLRYRDDSARRLVVRISCVIIPVIGATLFLTSKKPVWLVLVGAVAQALMLTPLALCALHLRHRVTPKELRPGRRWTLLLWLAALSIAAVGFYKVFTILGGSG